MTENQLIINAGDHVIVQRQGYTKLHKLKQHGNMAIGKFTVEMDNVLGMRYFDTFQMKKSPNGKKLFVLERVSDSGSTINNLNIEKSGLDNRDITVEEDTQALTKDDIDKLQDSELNSNTIIGELVNNSKTFNMKTEYSQEKYIKKKEKKYFEYIQLRRPTIRLLCNMFYRQDPTKTLGIRIDDLSQILTYANIQSEGNHMLYDSGTSGLMVASVMNAIGQQTSGTLIHMHPGNECQKNAFVAMQFPEEQRNRCINVNLYSVLRHYYQSEDPPCKKAKVDEPQKVPQWQLDNVKACEILTNKCDSLIVTCKEHPVNIVKELLPFLRGARQLVVFSLIREPLQDLFLYLKSRLDIVAIRLSNNFLRNYQVLPERTHPEVNMNSGGYILTAVKLNC
ncbi:tRNA (adenine(58)-N(1))-methyltransferase non-catalytic subunit TRM6 [Anthonomus grandis grandis]|uniref:tRNA (adenine(58)-N(1))-methyltransferase non-catalytic subunit TRM6 n=1 Tax=Anthonomus grandis grandis TaxID=2921223 RepID=UPI002165D698|nr:tRNA (adenine(58)-N(1))-methyltransferase non-catalytic subunit TRM6 [Anthonomus grandis grandis]